MAPKLFKIAATLAALAPLAATAILAATDLLHPEAVLLTEDQQGASKPIGPLVHGARLRIIDAVPRADATHVLLFPATYRTHPAVSLALCIGSVCEATHVTAEDNVPLRMRIPKGQAAGPLEIRIDRVTSGTFLLWGIEGAPQWALAKEGRWTHALRRANDHANACGGPSVAALLAISALGVGIASIASLAALLTPPRN